MMDRAREVASQTNARIFLRGPPNAPYDRIPSQTSDNKHTRTHTSQRSQDQEPSLVASRSPSAANAGS